MAFGPWRWGRAARAEPPGSAWLAGCKRQDQRNLQGNLSKGTFRCPPDVSPPAPLCGLHHRPFACHSQAAGVPWPQNLHCRISWPQNIHRISCPSPLQVKLLESPGRSISIAEFLGKAVEPPLEVAVASAIRLLEDIGEQASEPPIMFVFQKVLVFFKSKDRKRGAGLPPPPRRPSLRLAVGAQRSVRSRGAMASTEDRLGGLASLV